MPAISCVYCGGTHADAAEVRACWQRNDGREAEVASAEGTPFAEPEPAPAPPPTAAPAPPTQPSLVTPSGAVHTGPAALGRNALLLDGQAVPDEWAHVPVLHVRRHDPETLELLERFAHERSARVFVVTDATAPEAVAAQTTSEALHELGPRFVFTGDAVRHWLTVNTVDLRHGEQFPLRDLAAHAGARVVHDGRGDVELPDGTRAWLDGGPPRSTPPIDGVAVLHRVAVERGSLRPAAGGEPHDELAPDQRAAVLHPGGAARIIAPAGSGKTRVLTERARHLVQRWSLPASAVCLVAFNKRAQEEMVARTGDVRGLQVRTLNALALAVLNGSRPFAARNPTVSTIDESEVRTIIAKLVTFPRKRNSDPMSTWIDALSAARLGLRSPAEVERLYDGEVDGFEAFFPRYRSELARRKAVDYDEQIYRAIEVLLAEPATRAAAQFACRMLLVDEFQDLTPAHLLLVRLLAGPDHAVFGVGDDDQTIYGYNGADPAWLIDFASLFPGAGEHPLEVNYRCPGGIVRSADTLLRHNRRRVAKVIRAADPERDGFMVAPAEGDSVATTVQAVRTAVGAGAPATDIAVLARVNSLLAPVQVALVEAGVPVTGGVGREFVDRTAVRAALAWVRLATGSGGLDAADLAEALRRPSRSLHPRIADWVGEQTSLPGIRRLAERLNEAKDTERVLAFADDIEAMQRMASSRGTTAALVARLRDQMGLARTIASLDTHRHGMNRAAQGDDLTALAQLAELHPNPATFEKWLRAALSKPWSADGVTLATVHRVKGQEWPFVVVHHADAEQFPHRLADDVEEERRLFHVAITRASRDVLVVPSDRPSPFILDCSTEPSARPERSPASPGAPSPKPAAVRPGQTLTGDEAALFEELRTMRRHLAAGKPAYTVLPDTALHEIAVRKPSSLDELAAIKGVGPAKLSLYGAALLKTVTEFPGA